MSALEFSIPIQTKSATNLREHWAVRSKRVASERRATTYRTPPAFKALGPLLRITLTRVSPRELDDDNLRPALKGVRDALAASLRIDDRSPLVEWGYGQEKGTAAVLVRVEVLPA